MQDGPCCRCFFFLSAAIFITAGVQGKFEFTCGISKYEDAFNGAKANIVSNTKTDAGKATFHAGAFWDQVWVRDGSYSIQMACGTGSINEQGDI
jgi:hypothetical protein